VWAGVSGEGEAELHFVEMGVKVTAKNYLADIVETIMVPLSKFMFNGQPWTFQQDSTQAHKAKIVQYRLKTAISDFICIDVWPSVSPDLNSLDYVLWAK
jgi:hypothetical protein